jgi:quaternary ammonium compound-resistance protein SugE
MPHTAPVQLSVAWGLLAAAGLLEVLWLVALNSTDHLTRLIATTLSLLFAGAEFVLLSYVVRVIPAGTAYAVCMGIGAIGGVLVGATLFGESYRAFRLVCIGLIVAGTVGIRATQ